MVQTDPTLSVSTTTSNFYCPYRLPCGYCKELKCDCPKQNGTTITWNDTAGPSYINPILTKDPPSYQPSITMCDCKSDYE